jgi:maltose O-acetyltransferase
VDTQLDTSPGGFTPQPVRTNSRGRLRRNLAVAAYYLVAQRLPGGEFPGGERFRKIRMVICRQFLAASGEWFNIGPDVYIADGRYLTLGYGSGIGKGARVYGGVIGEGVMIAPGAVLFKNDHRFDDLDGPIGDQGDSEIRLPVIEDWAWVGERAMVLPGRTVGRGAIVGAGSVVTRDVEPYTIVAGNPARVVGDRRNRAT